MPAKFPQNSEQFNCVRLDEVVRTDERGPLYSDVDLLILDLSQ